MLLLLSLLASAQALPVDHGNSPTVLQYVLEAVVDLPNWSHYLPDDIDVDKDGNLNEKEVELKFKSYVKDAFDQLDKDVDKLVTQDEFQNASIKLNGINKIIDIAMKSYPIKTFLGFGDRNQDGFIDEHDFLIPVNKEKLLGEYYKEKFGDKLPKYWGQKRGKRVFPSWTLKSSVPVLKKSTYDDGDLLCLDNFGEKEATVLCREMGHEGVESVSSISFDEYKLVEENRRGYLSLYEFKFDCEGTETNLEECIKTKKPYSYGTCPNYSQLLASVNCTLKREIGEVHLAGGKDASTGDLHIGLEKYCGDISRDMAKVVCTELGFVTETPLVTTNNFFTSHHGYGPPSIERRFVCNGTEQKLQDCQAVITNESKNPNYCNGSSNGIICKSGAPLWEKYGPLPEARTQNPAYYNDAKGGFYIFWDEYARYLFIADTDGDHKVSMEELNTKIKEIVAAVFQVLDQTDDGVFSASDLTTLNLRLEDVGELARKLFQVLAKGEQQFDLRNYIIFRRPLKVFDYNRDNIINLKDLSHFIDSSQVKGLATILSRELDINQDGIILVTELDNYIKRVFDHLGGGTLTLDTVWKLMKESKFTCLQLNGVRTFVEAVADNIDYQSKKMLDYLFRELDLDGNGEIPVEELYNAHVPCDEVNIYHRPKNDSDRMGCDRLVDEFVFPDWRPKAPRGVVLSIHPGPDDNEIWEKLANAACVAMQPHF